MDSKKENQHPYREMGTMWKFLRGVEQLDEQRAWTRIQKRLESKLTKRRWLRSLYKYAAIVAIVALCGGIAYYRYEQGNKSKQVLSALQLIQPGKPQATLHLSDGQIVDLTHTNQSVLTDQTAGQKVKLNKQDHLVDYRDADASKPSATEPVYHKIVVPRGGEYVLILSDGSKVWLNADSELEYPPSFAANRREVRLKGEAYFDVVKNPKSRFHVVMAGGATIEVSGTAFNACCYPEDGVCSAVLESGQIDLATPHSSTQVAVGECATYDIASAKVSIKPVELKYYTAWHNGMFYFHNAPLAEIMQKLERWYNVSFRFADESLRNVCFSGAAIREKPIGLILELLAATQSLDYSIEDDGTIVIHKK